PVRRLILASPFDYPSQALLGVVTDLPSPQARGFEAACQRALLELAAASGGGAFFLFTSHGQLRRAYTALSGPLARLGLKTLCQGMAGKRALLEHFRGGAPAVLFGTDSFWEGVDIRGERLRLVV